MIFGQVLGNGQTGAVHKQKAVAVFVNLHVITGADPGAMFDLLGLVRIEAARAERLAQGLMVVRQSKDHRFCHFGSLLLGSPHKNLALA